MENPDAPLATQRANSSDKTVNTTARNLAICQGVTRGMQAWAEDAAAGRQQQVANAAGGPVLGTKQGQGQVGGNSAQQVQAPAAGVLDAPQDQAAQADDPQQQVNAPPSAKKKRRRKTVIPRELHRKKRAVKETKPYLHEGNDVDEGSDLEEDANVRQGKQLSGAQEQGQHIHKEADLSEGGGRHSPPLVLVAAAAAAAAMAAAAAAAAAAAQEAVEDGVEDGGDAAGVYNQQPAAHHQQQQQQLLRQRDLKPKYQTLLKALKGIRPQHRPTLAAMHVRQEDPLHADAQRATHAAAADTSNGDEVEDAASQHMSVDAAIAAVGGAAEMQVDQVQPGPAAAAVADQVQPGPAAAPVADQVQPGPAAAAVVDQVGIAAAQVAGAQPAFVQAQDMQASAPPTLQATGIGAVPVTVAGTQLAPVNAVAVKEEASELQSDLLPDPPMCNFMSAAHQGRLWDGMRQLLQLLGKQEPQVLAALYDVWNTEVYKAASHRKFLHMYAKLRRAYECGDEHALEVLRDSFALPV